MTNAAVDSILHWLLRTSLEASALMLVVLGLRSLLGPRLSPAWRVALWTIVGLKLLLPACIPAGFGLGQWLTSPGKDRVTTEHREEMPGVPLPGAATARSPSSPLDSASVNDLGGSLAVSHGQTLRMETAAPLGLVLWLVGCLTIVAAAFRRHHHLERLLDSQPVADDPRLLATVARLQRLAGVKVAVSVILMPPGTTPAVVGIRRPRLLLPVDWPTRFDDASLRHVVLHELLHVRHSDLCWNWIAVGLQGLHWFNPLVWLVVSRFQADRELRCDAKVLQLLNPSERLAYGHTLLRIQETLVFAPPATAGLAPCVRNHPSLRQRITMITHPTRRQTWLQIVLALTMGVLTCYSFTTARAEREEEGAPVKERSRDGGRDKTDSDEPPAEETEPSADKTTTRDGDVKKTGERDGDVRKSGPRDGEDRKRGPRDGEEGAQKTSPRDGDEREKKVGPRDGEEKVKRTGPRDGEIKKVGPGDGEARAKKPLLPPGEKPVKKPLLPPGEKPVKKPPFPDTETPVKRSVEAITLRVINGGDAVLVGKEEVPMNQLRGYLSKTLALHFGAPVTITADSDVPYGAVLDTLDAARDNGAKNATIERQ